MSSDAAPPSSYRAGSGEPLVLVHGLGSCWPVWKPILGALERAHEVLAFDLPGFGEAPALPQGTPPTVPALTDAAERELDAAGIESAHLVGNSMGGWIVLELARRGRARTVVALSPAGLATPREDAFAHRSLAISRAIAERIAPAAELLMRTAAGRTLGFAQMHARPWRLAPDQAAYQIRAFARSPAFPSANDWLCANHPHSLEHVECPALIAWGTADRLLLPRQAPRWQARIPGAQLQMLPALGHMPIPDDPELVASTILGVTAPERVTPANVSASASG